MQSTEINHQILTIHQNGQHISIDEEQLQSLGGDLTVRQLVGTADSHHGYSIQQVQQSLLHSHDDDDVRNPGSYRLPNAGCIPLLRQRAVERGIDLRVTVLPSIVQLPAPANSQYLWYPSLARFVGQYERGQIRISKNFDASIIVLELALAYPEKRIIVLDKNTATLNKTANQLRTKLDEVTMVCSSRRLQIDDDEDMPRVICSTFIEASTIDFSTSDIVIMLDATHCCINQAQLALEQVDAQFRLFGIVRAGNESSPYVAGVLMRVFGPEMLDLLSYCRIRREASVAWVKNNQPTIQQERQNSKFDYKCCWHNERRNREIKKIAKKLLAGSPLGNPDICDVSAWFQEHDYGPQAVTILVECLDQAIALGEKLPDWPIITNENIDLYGYPRRDRTRLKLDKQRWKDGTHQIVLTDAAAHFRGNVSDVVIWAGSGSSIDSIPASWLAEPCDSDRPLLIIDFHDRFNRQMRQWHYSRKASYAKRDIFEVGVSPSQGRINQFLNAQQRGQQ